MTKSVKLTGILDAISKSGEGEKIKVGAAVDMLEHRGYGPLLLAPPLLNILPTGFLPGVPTVVTVLIVFIAAQIAWGRKVPWIPERIRGLSFSRENFEKARLKVEPVTRKIDRFIKPRFQQMVSYSAVRLIACFCIVIALLIPFLEVIPFAGSIPSLAIVLFSLGISARDGGLVMGGVVFAFLTFGTGIYLLL